MSQTTPAATKKIECFSMTGYAQARAEQDGWAVRVSVKSVNHRFLDLKLRMPEGFDLYDLRLTEGRHLVEELRDRLARIGGYVDQVRGLAATLRPAFARRLETRLKELLGGIGIEPARLAQEAALLAERSDISEELDRLKS